jgi:UDP-N-acetyl-D-mannosaminuronic acid dehydrogenase
MFNALKQLDYTMEKLLICVDDKKKLKGVINDGDIRRALLKGASLNEPVMKYMQKNPHFVTEQCSFNDAMRNITSRVQILPVIDHLGKVMGMYSIKEKRDFVDIKMRDITVVGMGYVGLTLALALSDIGFDVKGYDIDKKLIGDLKKGKSRFYERGLQQYLDHLKGSKIKLHSDVKKCQSSIYIITVGTPIKPGLKKPNAEYTLKAAKEISAVLERGDLVILRSTVPIGFCREQVLPVLEKESGLKVGENFYLAFAPERTVEGRALMELRTNPQIIGGYDAKSTELSSRLFNCLTHSVIDVETLEAAEMCKLIDNTFRDHLFAFANQLVPLSENFGLDLCKVIDAVNHGYHRNSVPKPSPGVGGTCLSKDPYILNQAFERYKLKAPLIMNGRKINENGHLLVRDKLNKLLKSAGKDIRKAKILLVGLAFKGSPETSDLRDSTSVWFLNSLPSKNNVYGYDPVVPDKDILKLGIKPVSLKEGFTQADAIVILTNHQSYRDINIFKMTKLMRKPAVFIDTWHIFEPYDLKRIEGVIYGGVGND